MARIRPNLQIQKSIVPGSLLLSDASNEAIYYPPGAAGSVLTVVGGVPTFQAPTPQGEWTIVDSASTAQVISAGDTLTVVGGNGATATVSATDTLTILARLSTAAGNDITFGPDGGLFLSKDNLLTGASWDDTTNSLTITFDGLPNVTIPILDVVGAFLADFTIAADSGTADVVNNHETVNFLGGVGIITAVTANTITITLDIVKETFSTLTTGNTITISQVPGKIILVTRNGLEQILGTDYTIAGATITVISAFGVSTGATGSEEMIITYEKA